MASSFYWGRYLYMFHSITDHNILGVDISYEWMAQAERDALRFGDGLPAVFFRRSRSPWLVVMKLEDWIRMYTSRDLHNI